jgi:predicted O-linked N-acetylglucosamine transferase (SPINDLY family)
MDESVYSEKTIRLPDSFWCYDPLDGREITISPLPMVDRGPLRQAQGRPRQAQGSPVTFACLNNFCKISEGTLNLWAEIMHQVQGSRLVLLAPHGSHRQRTIDLLASEGIEPGRIEFVAFLPRREFLRTFNRIDLGLDSFPYNGHTTSLDSFWMGVPVVTLVGQTAVSRAGWCMLSNLGLVDLAAESPERYVQKAVQLAQDPARLGELRSTLRQRVQQSPLMDGPRFARHIEAAYRQMWRKWCVTHCS